MKAAFQRYTSLSLSAMRRYLKGNLVVSRNRTFAAAQKIDRLCSFLPLAALWLKVR